MSEQEPELDVSTKVLPPQKEGETKLILRVEGTDFFAEKLAFTLVSQKLDHDGLSGLEEMLSVLSMGAYILQSKITEIYQEMGQEPPPDQSGLTLIDTVLEDEEEEK